MIPHKRTFFLNLTCILFGHDFIINQVLSGPSTEYKCVCCGKKEIFAGKFDFDSD